MLSVDEVEQLLKLEDIRREISTQVEEKYTHKINVGKNIKNLKEVHLFFKELRELLADEVIATSQIESFLQDLIEKYDAD